MLLCIIAAVFNITIRASKKKVVRLKYKQNNNQVFNSDAFQANNESKYEGSCPDCIKLAQLNRRLKHK